MIYITSLLWYATWPVLIVGVLVLIIYLSRKIKL